MISNELVEILVCPEDRTPVHRAEQDLIDRLNESIRAGELKTREGELVLDLLEEGLIREDGAVLYPVREGIPIMLVSESIALADAAAAD